MVPAQVKAPAAEKKRRRSRKRRQARAQAPTAASSPANPSSKTPLASRTTPANSIEPPAEPQTHLQRTAPRSQAPGNKGRRRDQVSSRDSKPQQPLPPPSILPIAPRLPFYSSMPSCIPTPSMHTASSYSKALSSYPIAPCLNFNSYPMYNSSLIHTATPTSSSRPNYPKYLSHSFYSDPYLYFLLTDPFRPVNSPSMPFYNSTPRGLSTYVSYAPYRAL
jgi:hypothetical protein